MNLEKIFEEFYQVESGITDKTPGTGLGLSLVKSMVEMHGGKIKVESEGKDKGSCFSFTIPVQSVAGDDSRSKKDEWLTVLKSEDDLLVRNWVNIFIAFAARHKRKFSIGCFKCEGKPFVEKIAIALRVIGEEKRAYDIVEADVEGYVYFIMPEEDSKGAQSACSRIERKIQPHSGEDKVTYTLVKYPEDGETAEILLEKSRTYSYHENLGYSGESKNG